MDSRRVFDIYLEFSFLGFFNCSRSAAKTLTRYSEGATHLLEDLD